MMFFQSLFHRIHCFLFQNFYCTSVPHSKSRQLRSDLLENANVCPAQDDVISAVQSSPQPKLSSTEPAVLGFVLKRYFSELPDSLIPSALYDAFLASSSLPSEAAQVRNGDLCMHYFTLISCVVKFSSHWYLSYLF